MVSLKEYRFAYKGLGNGSHQLSFDIDSSFFAHFEMSKIKEADIQVKVDMDKRDNMITLDFDIAGSYVSPCDRCMATIDVPVSGEDQLIIKFVESDAPADDETVIYVDPKETHIDLTEIIYEMIHVHLPMMSLRDCEAEDYEHCDHEVLDRLEGVDEDESDDDRDDDTTNPLWEGLKDIEL